MTSIRITEQQELPDGTEVAHSKATTETDKDIVPPNEIARIITAMGELESLELPDNVAAELDAWERRIDQHGLAHTDIGLAVVFP